MILTPTLANLSRTMSLTGPLACLCLFYLAIGGIPVRAEEYHRDTIRLHDPRVERVSYPSAGLNRQCARVWLAPGSNISEIRVWLAGPAGGSAKLEVFGHEGGLLVPRLEQSITEPRPLMKKTSGREAVRVAFDEGLKVTGGQVFVSITDIDEDVRLLCTGFESQPECLESNGQMRYASLQQSVFGDWTFTGFMPWIEVVADQPASQLGRFTPDTVDVRPARPDGADYRYLSCFDLFGDGRVDIACGGILHINTVGGFTSLDLTRSDGTMPYAFGCDVDGDGNEELMSIGIAGDDRVQVHAISRPFTLTRRSDVVLPYRLVPGSMSQYDVNGDGRTDVVFSGVEEGSRQPRCLMILSEGSQGYRVVSLLDTALVGLLELKIGESAVVQFIPQTSRITSRGLRGRLLLRSTHGEVVLSISVDDVSTEGMVTEARAIATSDGTAPYSSFARDSLVAVPRVSSWIALKNSMLSMHKTGRGFDVEQVSDILIRSVGEFEEALSSIVLADLNNDGADEYIVCSKGKCRFLRVFSWADGELVDVTSRYGLNGIDDAPDISVADFDLDGRMDIAVDRRDRLEIWNNQLPTQKSMWRLLASDIAEIRTISTDNSDWQHCSSISGRGRLIQDVRAVQLSSNSDSLVVRWAESGRDEIFEATPGKRISKGAGRPYRDDRSDRVIRITQAGSGLRIEASHVVQSARLSIINLEGRTLVSSQFGTVSEGTTVVPLADIAGGIEVASGQYSVLLEAKGIREVCQVVVVR